LRFGCDSAGDSALIEAARKRRVPLTVIDIADAAVAELYQCRFALVRPDGHVAWRGNDEPKDALGLIDWVRGATP
jgi:hypothetical protein